MDDEDLGDLFELLGELITDVVSAVAQPWVAITLLIVVALAATYVATEEQEPHFLAPSESSIRHSLASPLGLL
jgi:hypothetical protein